MLIPYICRSFYFFAGITALISEFVPQLRTEFVHYGKVKTTTESSNQLENLKAQNQTGTKSSTSSADFFFAKINITAILRATVSKNSFLYFYLFGTMVSCLLLLHVSNWETRKTMYNPITETDPWFFGVWKTLECKLSPLKSLYLFSIPTKNIELCEPFTESVFRSCVWTLGLYTIHVILRLIETAYWQPLSNAKIHIGHFIVGIFFYILTPFAVFADSIYVNGSIPNSPTLVVILATLLFFYSIYTRYKCHQILFNLKNLSRQGPSSLETTKDNQYSIPMGGWFNRISSPHYTAEILMYFSLYFIAGTNNISFIFLLFWVVVNLTISATETHYWYKRTFKSKYPINRYALIPYIW
ncbi:hypothetical protein BB561_002404 [Smittium simulii]|uniref:3-oxo-5-alpha-steroid 4-dehydrogenase C-terminal domain-containing protein n=1 Tax=Smittium simulii TaxID=133385 RepID=A0A2T9YQL1_9FUNG|nr:hypothetical protein BB561_002404 [Smittium simulii]